jgi:pimeloyl-ACP methyl ester carboxylesterase
VLSEDYGRAYCAAIPGARFEPIARAGHYPHIEAPDAFARAVFAFTQGQAK